MSISYFPTKEEQVLLYRENNIEVVKEKNTISCNDPYFASVLVKRHTKKSKKALKKEYKKLCKKLKKKEKFCLQYYLDNKEYVEKLLQHIKSINYTTKTVGGEEVRDLQLFFNCDYAYKELCQYYIGGYIVILSNRIDHDLNIVGKIETIGFVKWDIYGKNLYGIKDRDLILSI